MPELLPAATAGEKANTPPTEIQLGPPCLPTPTEETATEAKPKGLTEFGLESFPLPHCPWNLTVASTSQGADRNSWLPADHPRLHTRHSTLLRSRKYSWTVSDEWLWDGGTHPPFSQKTDQHLPLTGDQEASNY